MARLHLRRPGSRGLGRPPLSTEEKAQRETLRRRRKAPPPAEWTLAAIARISEWVVEPTCTVRDPPGILTSAEVARLLRGLDPIAKLVVVRLLGTFWDWPEEDHATLRAFGRAGARVMLLERAPTTVAARRRVHSARTRLAVLAARLRLTTDVVRAALAPFG